MRMNSPIVNIEDIWTGTKMKNFYQSIYLFIKPLKMKRNFCFQAVTGIFLPVIILGFCQATSAQITALPDTSKTLGGSAAKM